MCGRLVNLDTVARVLADYYHIKTDTQLAALNEALSRVPTETVGDSHKKDHVADPGKMVGDSISRQAALDALGERPVVWTDKIYYILGARNQYDMDRLAIETVPSAQQWISVTERLPENDNDVLVTDGTDCAVAYWRTDAQAWDDSMHGWCDLYGLDVIAWMPLPEAWKGEEDD